MPCHSCWFWPCCWGLFHVSMFLSGTQISCFAPTNFSWRQAAYVDSFCWAAVHTQTLPLWLHKVHTQCYSYWKGVSHLNLTVFDSEWKESFLTFTGSLGFEISGCGSDIFSRVHSEDCNGRACFLTYNDLSIMTPDKPAQETDDQTADRAQKHS